MDTLPLEVNSPAVLLALQFTTKDPELIARLKEIRVGIIEERGLIQPSFDPVKQLELHGQLGYLMGQIMLLDDMILALTLPPVSLTDQTNLSE